ncbi:MAG: hypothetical protein JWL86_6987 [Rhizobium sp.]|nr:hypothetical protein [Rhizobium sp.]
MACRFVNENLDEGEEIEELFDLHGEERAPVWEDCGYWLKVRRRGGGFRIGFGFRAGPEAGDGAEWNVKFTKDGGILCEGPLDQWIG